MKTPKVLLLDHRDSFTWNVVELLRSLHVAYQVADYTLWKKFLTTEKFSHIILSPGPGMPHEYVYLQALMKQVSETPVLGICLGHQLLAGYFGARLINMPRPAHGEPKIIQTTGHGLFQGLPVRFQVGLYHSWMVSRDDFPRELEETAWGPNREIMAFQHQTKPLFGVQFHPESYITEYGREMVSNFLNS